MKPQLGPYPVPAPCWLQGAARCILMLPEESILADLCRAPLAVPCRKKKKTAGIPGGDLASNGTQAFEGWGLFLLLNDGMMLWEISVSDNILLPSGEPFAHQK